ncbi:SH3 domain-containing protein [Arthrobacter sp.]|uniref:SH3 domain-containing protein n=1 Tax=Arthrobacter sp. TaxID=1667 RepID=UPI003A907117
MDITPPPAGSVLDRRRLFGVAAVAAASLLGGAGMLLAPPPATAATTRVRTTANLNVRASASASGRRLGTLDKGSTVTTTGRASNGWYRITYRGRTGYVSNRYAKVVAVAKKTSATKSTRIRVRVQTLAALNVRSTASTGGKRLGTLKKNAKFTATGVAANGWYRLSYRGKTGYVSHRYLKPDTSKEPAYTSTRNGLPTSARYYFSANGSDLSYLPNGSTMIGDLPAGTVAWRDTRMERAHATPRGWYCVRTAGATGWVRASALRRSQPRTSTWSRRTTAAQVRRMPNGKLASSNLVAISWDPGQNLIAGPALRDLTKLDQAFKRKFGRHLEIDLTYRTRGTQEYLYRELGRMIAATPGTSNHGWGLAIDFPETRDYGFGGRYHTWLKAHSKSYGWVHHKVYEKGSPYAEAWHFEYMR